MKDVAGLEGATVFLDLDGTVVPPAREDVSEETRAAVEALSAKNAVWIVSNRRTPGRKDRLASRFGIKVLAAKYRKPDPRLRGAVAPLPKPYVVIGDRYLTDGLFARLIGARFIQVKRVTGPHDGFLDRFLAWSDDLLTGGVKD
jgi:HAD superfamily phosphatase (TIGR01668 family)